LIALKLESNLRRFIVRLFRVDLGRWKRSLSFWRAFIVARDYMDA